MYSWITRLITAMRIDLSARFAGQGNPNLAEYIGHGDARRVTLRLDSWLGS